MYPLAPNRRYNKEGVIIFAKRINWAVVNRWGGGLMFSRQCGDSSISKLLELLVNIALLVNIGLHSKGKCLLFTYPY